MDKPRDDDVRMNIAKASYRTGIERRDATSTVSHRQIGAKNEIKLFK